MLLFYSNRCPECKKFISILKEYPNLSSTINKIDIESIPYNQVPRELSYVPGILDDNKLIMGPDAFKWLEEKVKSSFLSLGTQSFVSGDHGVEFSFIGDQDIQYDTKSAVLGKEHNGVDPDKFDSRTGQPLKPEKPMELPLQLQPMKIDNGSRINDQNANDLLSRLENERKM
jgi:hypothetical protein